MDPTDPPTPASGSWDRSRPTRRWCQGCPQPRLKNPRFPVRTRTAPARRLRHRLPGASEERVAGLGVDPRAPARPAAAAAPRAVALSRASMGRQGKSRWVSRGNHRPTGSCRTPFVPRAPPRHGPCGRKFEAADLPVASDAGRKRSAAGPPHRDLIGPRIERPVCGGGEPRHDRGFRGRVGERDPDRISAVDAGPGDSLPDARPHDSQGSGTPSSLQDPEPPDSGSIRPHGPTLESHTVPCNRFRPGKPTGSATGCLGIMLPKTEQGTCHQVPCPLQFSPGMCRR